MNRFSLLGLVALSACIFASCVWGDGDDDRWHRRGWGHPAAPGGAACMINNDCGPGVCCVSGRCQPTSIEPPVCQFNSECGAHGRCINGSCERSCAAPADCGTGAVCSAGFCQPSTTAGGQCVYNRDCAGTGKI